MEGVRVGGGGRGRGFEEEDWYLRSKTGISEA